MDRISDAAGGANELARQTPPCKICGGPTGNFIEREGYPIVRCAGCGFMFALLPAGFAPADNYSDDSYFSAKAAHGIADYESLWSDLLSHLYVPRLRRMRELGCAGGSLLDIGCAGGNLMVHAERMGWTTRGVELSDFMRQRASKLTGRQVYGSISEASRSGRKFDCVTMFAVIEHVDDPVSVMREVAGLLNPGGMLALSTPNCDSPEALGNQPINVWFIPPEHISYFGRRTITDCLKAASLNVLAIDGLEGVWRAHAGDTSFPPWLTRLLRRWRKDKRLRPGGLIGKILKRAYSPAARPDIYRRRYPAELDRAELIEVYARKV